MSTIKWALGFAFLSLVLLVGSAFASTTELLYVLEGKIIVTYSVNKKLGTLGIKFGSIVSVNRSGSFRYILGFTSATHEVFNVYSLTAAGVPNVKLVQTLAVKPALARFYIHPNGVDAYAMYAWTTSGGWASDIVLFTINPKTGKLTNTTKTVANFPLNDFQATIIPGMDSKGTKLYTGVTGWYGEYYSYFPINAKTGALGAPVPFWSDDYSAQYSATSAFSDSLIAQVNNGNGFDANYINIGQIGANLANAWLFACDATMLIVCGDSAYNLWMHPSGKYIFVADQTTNEVPILYISTLLSKLVPSGASIPGIPRMLGFSPDGLLVYAVEGPQILTYVFNPHSGLLTARTTINAPGAFSILPWL
jgi:hypothetical protein